MHTPPVQALAALVCALAVPLAARAQTQAPASGSSLSGCRSIADATARLACYDALPVGPTAVAVPAGLAVQPSQVARPTGAAAATASAAATAAADAPAAASFGIDRKAPGELQEISSRFEGDFDGWGPTTRIRLANGQVWQVVDGSSAPLYLRSPRVVVKRALLGGYVMEFEGTNRTARVRRVD